MPTLADQAKKAKGAFASAGTHNSDGGPPITPTGDVMASAKLWPPCTMCTHDEFWFRITFVRGGPCFLRKKQTLISIKSKSNRIESNYLARLVVGCCLNPGLRLRHLQLPPLAVLGASGAEEEHRSWRDEKTNGAPKGK